MIKRNRIESTEIPQIVFVRGIVAVPSNNIKWCVILKTIKHLTHEFVYQFEGDFICVREEKRGKQLLESHQLMRMRDETVMEPRESGRK